ncbi:MAG TPA: extracellular solute-binding protein [Mycobacteriales bacterium]|nr:extracellular solute-binding protein [Mycobacteriales bacterium]
MRTRIASLVAAATATLLVGSACGGGAADTGNVGGSKPSGSAGNSVYDQINALPKAKQRSKAVQLAKKEGSLSFYTSMTQDVADAVSKAFQQKFGIKVSVFRGNSETVLQRVLQESSANKLGADAVETNFLEMETMSKQGLLAPYQGSGLDKVVPTAKFTDWTASRFNVFLPAWNTDRIKPGQEPKSWEDLASPRFKGKITVELSDSDWYENVTAYWLGHGKSQAQVDALWKKIFANSKTAKGHTTMMQLLQAGQTPMDGMNYTYITDRAADQGAPVADRGADGTNPIPAFPRPNGVGAFTQAKHPAAAWLFYDWLLNEGQQTLVDLHLTPSTKVAGDKSLDGINLVPFDVKTLTTDATTWETKYDNALRGVAATK